VIDKNTRTLVWQRADSICEYCRLWQEHEPFLRFQVEHIIPKKHGGTDAATNLALACFFCNSHKSSNLAGIDPKTGRLARLFHPRRQKWDLHFQWK
jgi:5-methylcytosine-specific restriction endonuclease McrA